MTCKPLRRMALAIATLMLGTVTLPALCSQVWCTGTADNIYVTTDGSVVFQASYRGDYTQVCNLQGAWQGVPIETCFTWYSSLMSAKAHNFPVILYYQTTYTCATLPTYGSAPVPYYIMVTS